MREDSIEQVIIQDTSTACDEYTTQMLIRDIGGWVFILLIMAGFGLFLYKMAH